MGASSSVNMGTPPPHIHISVPIKRHSYKEIIDNIKTRLEDIGFIVTLTDETIDTKAIYSILRNAHAVIMCNCANSYSCSIQAIEYSYIVDNYKKSYQIIIDPSNHTLLSYLKNILGSNTMTVSTINDISCIIKEINNNHVVVRT